MSDSANCGITVRREPEKSNLPTEEQVHKLYEQLQKLQEAKGYFFNKNSEMVRELLYQLLITKSKYGYMACPCRMINGSYALDKDIICPCVYRAPDVKEFGACYCGLYVSKEWNMGLMPEICVPERRPPEKIVF